MLTVEEVATELRLSYRKVLSLIHEEKIKAIRIGRKFLIKEAELNRVKREGIK